MPSTTGDALYKSAQNKYGARDRTLGFSGFVILKAFGSSNECLLVFILEDAFFIALATIQVLRLVFIYLCIRAENCTKCMQMSAEARRGCQIPPRAGVKSEPPSTYASARALCTLNCCSSGNTFYIFIILINIII